MSDFYDTFFNQRDTPVKTISVHYMNDDEENHERRGLFLGIELIDLEGESIMTAGKTDQKKRSNFIQFQLEKGERIIGMVSKRHGRNLAHSIDV